ncbi:MAG: hypothetical protein ACHQDB_02665 [Steroidobacterales bacterium]
MIRPARFLWLILLAAGASRAEDADDEARVPAARANSGTFTLTQSQQQAVGIRIDHPMQMASPQQVDAYGLVLDPVALVSDAGHVDSTQAAAEAAAAEVARLDGLYRNNADASLKALQTARSLATEAAAQAQTAATTFKLQWGPVAALSVSNRRELIDQLSAGRHLLVRADVPGHQLLSSIAARALVIADGVSVAARVLGALPRVDPQSQSTGWLLEIDRRPEGLGPGARTHVRLQAAPVSGVLVPAAALLYAEHGAYVYREVSGSGTDKTQYIAVPVRLLVRVGDGWLVHGLGRADSIVVQGAGVLWSLEGISTFSAAEEEHD